MKSKWKLNNETKIRQVGSMDVTDLDGEKVMMDLQQGYYFMLNEVGTRIWDISKETTTISNIITILLEEYEVEEEACKEQVLSFVEDLLDKQLLMVESA